MTLIGVAFEFDVSPLLIAASLLNVALLFIDRRYQAYLRTTAEYAIIIETEYNFASHGLTNVITEERNRQGCSRPENIFRITYIMLAIVSFIGFLAVFFGLI